MALVFSSNIADAQTIPLVTSTPMPNGNTEYALGIQILMGDDSLNTVTSHVDHYDSVYANSYRTCHPASGTRDTAKRHQIKLFLGSLYFLTLFIMSPVIDIIWAQALTPYLDGDMKFQDALATAQQPLREFMFSQTRDTDLAMFAELGGYPVFATREEVPLFVLLPSFSDK